MAEPVICRRFRGRGPRALRPPGSGPGCVRSEGAAGESPGDRRAVPGRRDWGVVAASADPGDVLVFVDDDSQRAVELLTRPVQVQDGFEGRITDSDDEGARIDVAGQVRAVDYDEVAKAIVQVEFPKEAG